MNTVATLNECLAAGCEVIQDFDNEEAMGRMSTASQTLGELVVFPVTPWRLSRGFQSSATATEGFRYVYEDVLNGTNRYENPDLSARNAIRADMIMLGNRAPLSGKLRDKEIPEFYEVMFEGLMDLSPNGVRPRKFVDFAKKRIRERVFEETTTIHSGHNLNPIPYQNALEKLQVARDCVGTRYGLVGKTVLTIGERISQLHTDPDRRAAEHEAMLSS